MAKEQLFRSYLSSALFLIQQYSGKTPFSFFLKEYFSGNKKYGSRDRKYIIQLCYCYYRSGRALKGVTPEKKMLDSLFLCSTTKNELLENLQPAWNEKATLPLENKMAWLYPEFNVHDIFPWPGELSEAIDIPAFCLSHLIQPSLFLRIRPGYGKAVLSKLSSHGIPFEEINEHCLAVLNTTKLDGIIELDKEAVVQDLNSQKVEELLKQVEWGASARVWDCCAASGGKSMMLYDMKPEIKLTVSDIRENILSNLRKRFATAGIREFKSFTADLSNQGHQRSTENYQLILADVPCTGSGTWSRTPDQLFYFDKDKLGEYASLQKKILANVIPSLQAGGYLLYITCSVFKKENEEAVKFLQQSFQLQLVKMEMLKGYDKKADTLFAALLKN